MLDTSGNPLDSATRGFMQRRLGHNFADVRVHADEQAARSASSVGSVAYTVGRDVVFGRGQYAPQTLAGRQLIAHELTHVVQQRGTPGALSPHLEIGQADSPLEREADRSAAAIVAGSGPLETNLTHAPASVQRACHPAGIGHPIGCTVNEDFGTFVARGQTGPFTFNVNCDDFEPGQESLLLAFANGRPPDDTFEVHGYASEDGPALAAFNTDLACARALAARRRLVATGRGVTAVINHGPTPGPARERRAVTVRARLGTPPTPPPAPTPGPLCPAVPATTPATCSARHDAYCAAARCFPLNSWLACVCGASADVCRAVNAFSFVGSEGEELSACVTLTGGDRGLTRAKAAWLLTTNSCIWGHWRAALEAINDPTRPVPASLTAEWADVVTVCRRDGVGSGSCCQASVIAEQNAIERCGAYDSTLFGRLPTDVPGSRTCSSVVLAATPGLPFTGDFGKVRDRISYGMLRCCTF